MRKVIAIVLVLGLLGGLSVIVIGKGFFAEELKMNTQPASTLPASAADLARQIRNADVKWDGTVMGLTPRLSAVTLDLLGTSENIEPFLLEALVDEDRFVAAHVLLTFRSQPAFSSEGGTWNGLQVKLSADGQVSYDGNDLAELQMWWEEKLQ